MSLQSAGRKSSQINDSLVRLCVVLPDFPRRFESAWSVLDEGSPRNAAELQLVAF